MQSNTAFKFAPVYSDEKKVDVAIDGDQAVVKLSSWVEGLGWCGQKTMSLDAALLDELHRVITAARIKIKSEQRDENTVEDSNVLAFPTFA